MVFFFSLSFFKFCLNKRILSRGQFYSLFQYFFFSYLSFVWWAVKVLLKVWIKRILSGGRVCGGQWIERTKKSISGSSNYSSGKLSKTLRENIFWKRKYFFKRKSLEKNGTQQWTKGPSVSGQIQNQSEILSFKEQKTD